ncbi:hypothetical protein DFH09DRAFT_1359195 [Mycena vulgaris]|nr:hypothetical protein DFH09DRAFT_1359195 [Mycena vulgaris]
MGCLSVPPAHPWSSSSFLGTNETHTCKAELETFLQFHRTGGAPLREDEISIPSGVLELNTKKTSHAVDEVLLTLTLSADAILDEKLVEAMYVPLLPIAIYPRLRFPSPASSVATPASLVHEPDDADAFIGLLLIRRCVCAVPSSLLMTFRNDITNKGLSYCFTAQNSSMTLPVSSFSLSILPEARPSINCFRALDYFPGKAGGGIAIIALERISSRSPAFFIVDETDHYEDDVSTQHDDCGGHAADRQTPVRGVLLRRRAHAANVPHPFL